ncbi:alpha/beta fold hydrolase [Glycomyces luteolus]|uniref:Alpha/beta fold hydrolase n=1 Tax=Glycomyces luteolus TaxID=2670330 RepID=A0A9X3P6D8_9ACTN|nr:alpha/beta fold hydrolase [Glycomyces luteolus]MDA1358959.1 alpha/beta fold hydrolase [Glycomyces luteolus]
MNRLPLVRHGRIDIDGVEVHYRESVPDRADAPVLLLLHGFPTASHQFRRLIDALGADHRLIAPDYPGFGQTTAPDDFTYTFDRLADIVEGFVDRLDLHRFAMYLFDFGAPVGLRLAERRPESITGLVVQNGNAYADGLSEAARSFIALAPEQTGAEGQIRDLLTLEGTRFQYETGAPDPSLIAPESWMLDQHYLDLPGRKEAQVALAFDYKSNVDRYDGWQAWLRKHRPTTLVVWGTGDPFFTEAGARAYLRDLPEAELHLLEAGHFTLETHLDVIAPLIGDFMERLR